MVTNDVLKNSLIILSYWIGIFIFLTLIQIITGQYFFSASNFLNYDAAHYYHISENGYYDFRVVFFPLFPKLWDALNFSVIGISLLNGFIYLCGLLVLSVTFKFSKFQLFLALLVPSNLFFFLPYSESVFFMASVILLVGISKDKLRLILAGLFMAALARPAYVVFLPAILIVEYFGVHATSVKIKRTFFYVAVIVGATILVGIIEYLDSGKWFTFFEEQKLWGNYLQIPTLPLRSWSGVFITRLDGAVLVIGIIALIIALIPIKNNLIKKQAVNLSPEILFSLLYIAGISISVFLFRGGSLFSLNRFVLCTPFFVLFLKYLNETIQVKRPLQFYGLSLLTLTVYWLFFFSFVHLQSFLKFLSVSIFMILIARLIVHTDRMALFFKLVLFLSLIELQAYLFIRFLTGQWVA